MGHVRFQMLRQSHQVLPDLGDVLLQKQKHEKTGPKQNINGGREARNSLALFKVHYLRNFQKGKGTSHFKITTRNIQAPKCTE
jgi:hypothetical protein